MAENVATGHLALPARTYTLAEDLFATSTFSTSPCRQQVRLEVLETDLLHV